MRRPPCRWKGRWPLGLLCTHLRTYGLNFDFGVASALLALAPLESSFELGCGLGLYTSWLQRLGRVRLALGIEPNPMPHSIFGEHGGPFQIAAMVRDCRAALMRQQFDLAL